MTDHFSGTLYQRDDRTLHNVPTSPYEVSVLLIMIIVAAVTFKVAANIGFDVIGDPNPKIAKGSASAISIKEMAFDGLTTRDQEKRQ